MGKNLLILLAGVILFSGCASIPTKDIRTDAQASLKTNFSGYKTYAWLGAAAILNDPYGQWKTPSFNATLEVKYLIDRELRKRGMSENSINPDLVVAFAGGVDMASLKLKVDPESKMTVLSNVPQAGLLVVLVDRASGYVNWAAVATGELQKNPSMKTAKGRLDYAVTEMFKKLPK
jgi:uncharacterized protein YceK